MLYFAYGSNLDWCQMRYRCPSASFVCCATLKDHVVAFTRTSSRRKCGVADVVGEPGHDIWGVVYEIDDREVYRLDRSEGFDPKRPENANAYNRMPTEVFTDGDETRPMNVETYVAVRTGTHLPSWAYRELIVAGAAFWSLPNEYLNEIDTIEVAP